MSQESETDLIEKLKTLVGDGVEKLAERLDDLENYGGGNNDTLFICEQLYNINQLLYVGLTIWLEEKKYVTREKR